MKTIPNEIITPILEILTYLGAAFVGWVAKWLQRNNIDNQKKNQ